MATRQPASARGRGPKSPVVAKADRGREPLNDVAVVGGSLAGCTAAIRFAQMGFRVVVLERKTAGQNHYKRLCTHFVQPSAVPVLSKLGLAHLADRPHAVPTKARFTTPCGVIDLPGGYVPEGPASYALNLERRMLDPALRAAAREHGVEFMDGTSVHSVEACASGWRVDARTKTRSRRVRARLVVAADGRRSRLAQATGNPTTLHANERAAKFGYFSGIDAPGEDRSLFILNEREMAFVYPLVGGRTLLSLYLEKPRAREWRRLGDVADEFLAYFAGLEDVPSVAGAVPETSLLGYSDYPSLVRKPAWGSIPFVGDAALSLDPMSGVGCGFALVSGDLLAGAFAGRSLSPHDASAALGEYARHFEQLLLPHASGICADSLVGKGASARLRLYQAISGDIELSRQFLALSGRLLAPADFQRVLILALANNRRGAVAQAATAVG